MEKVFKGTVVLAGAGASVGAGLPAALRLLDHIIRSSVREDWAASALIELTLHPRAGQRSPTDFLRFEEVLHQIGILLDEKLSLLDFIADFDEPGPVHWQLASGSGLGLSIVTPNFDHLFERALVELGLPATTIHLPELGDRGTTGIVHKLHGSLRDFKYGRQHPSANGIVATIGQLARGNASFAEEPEFADALREMIAGNRLIVVGYSASDDLDIVPALATTEPGEVVWIDHSESRPRRVYPVRPKWVELVAQWEDCSEVTVVRGSTVDALQQLGFPSPSEKTKGTAAVPDWSQHIEKWAEGVMDRDPSGLGLAAQLFAAVDRSELQRRALEESTPGTHPIDGWSAGTRHFELAQHAYLYELPEEELLASLELAKGLAQDNDDEELRFLCQTLEGRLLFWNARWLEAIKFFEELVADDSGGSAPGYAQSWLGRAHLWSGDAKRALPLLRLAEPLISDGGHLIDLLDVLTGLAYAELETGASEKALDAAVRMREVAETISDGRMLCQAFVVLAEIHLFTGDSGLALHAARTAGKIGRSVEHPELCEVLDVLGAAEAQGGYPRRALRSYLAAVNLARSSGSRSYILASLAASRLDCGYRRAALRAAIAALDEENVDSEAELLASVVLLELGETDKDVVDSLAARWVEQHPPRLVRMASCLERRAVTTNHTAKIVERAREIRKLK